MFFNHREVKSYEFDISQATEILVVRMELVLEIENIVAHKVVDDSMLFLVKWKNVGPEFSVWMSMRKIPSTKLVYEYCLKNNITNIPVPGVRKRAEEMFNLLASVPDEVINRICEQFASTCKDEILLPPSNRHEILRKIVAVIDDDQLQCNRKLFGDLRERVLIERVIERRTDQLKKIQEFEWWINSETDNTEAIRVSNNKDLEFPPEYLKYVNDYVTKPNIVIPEISESDKDFSCTGEHRVCTKKCNCIGLFSGKASYKDDKMISSKNEVIHECNRLCSCGPQCGNRVVQNGCKIKIEIFRSATGSGWAVRTLEFLPKGTFVGRYVGQVITWEEGEHLSNSQIEGQYLFDIDYWKDENNGHSKYTVDAYEYGNFTRFINHSCSPNLTVYRVWINCLDPQLHEIAFFTTRNVQAGEELSFSYRRLFTECKCGSSRCIPKAKSVKLS